MLGISINFQFCPLYTANCYLYATKKLSLFSTMSVKVYTTHQSDSVSTITVITSEIYCMLQFQILVCFHFVWALWMSDSLWILISMLVALWVYSILIDFTCELSCVSFSRKFISCFSCSKNYACFHSVSIHLCITYSVLMIQGQIGQDILGSVIEAVLL